MVDIIFGGYLTLEASRCDFAREAVAWKVIVFHWLFGQTIAQISNLFSKIGFGCMKKSAGCYICYVFMAGR